MSTKLGSDDTGSWVGTLSNIITLDSWRDYMLLTGTLCPQFSSQWLHYMLQMGTQCLHYSAHTMLIIDTQCPYYHCPGCPINTAWRAFCTIEWAHIPQFTNLLQIWGAYADKGGLSLVSRDEKGRW